MKWGRILLMVALIFLSATESTQAFSISELRDQIEKKRQEKEKLEEENKKLEAQIDEANKKSQSLQGTVKALDTTQKKLQNDIKVTENKIGTTELSIKKVALEIQTKVSTITADKEALAKTIRNLQSAESHSTIEVFLQYDTLNEFWSTLEAMSQFQGSVRDHIAGLKKVKLELEGKQVEFQGKKQELVEFKGELSDRKVIVDQNKKTKSTLLAQTRNQETEYRRLLERNIELGRKFEAELFEFESQLERAIDRSKLPAERLGLLSWPLEKIIITQRFGKTVESRRLYVSGTHNGTDFRASVGTPVMAVSGGVVEGIGNTDEQAGCYSYGKWILVKHGNGLSSLYAHLSAIKMSSGQTVGQGEIIAYSGGQPGTFGSGFSTGPHLHLTLYASDGVKIQRYEASKFCKQVSIPTASASAYLDPLAYLPSL
ncbi:hypothetical protein EPN83_02160 [Patescibacteria group bacterium]|nr:MAG: hypothetical protein EPN83_02160 [Patescibacteria group bacterium]